MSIIGIVAVAKNLAIGKEGKLPWHYSSDLKFFKQTTSGHAVVMGYNTWLSIGKPLPNRKNIVMSRSRSIDDFPEVVVARNVDEVLDIAKSSVTDIFVIGGAETYGLFADSIDSWLVTEVPDEPSGADAFMPSDFLNGFCETEEIELEGGLKVKTFTRALKK